jgi:hypothetical protein
MPHRIRLYEAEAWRVVGRDSVERDEADLPDLAQAHRSVGPEEARSTWIELGSSLLPKARWRLQLAFATPESQAASDAEHDVVLTMAEPRLPEPGVGFGPVFWLGSSEHESPDVDLDADPDQLEAAVEEELRSLLGPCFVLVPSRITSRRLYGSYLLLGAPLDWREPLSQGELPDPTAFHYAAFFGQLQCSTGAPTPFLLHAGFVTSIVRVDPDAARPARPMRDAWMQSSP